MTQIKKNIEKKINDINQMLNELEIDEFQDTAEKEKKTKPAIDINKLDAVDVLQNILN